MDRPISIFKESNEDMGLLYNSYYPMISATREFLSLVDNAISDLVDHPDEIDIDLSNEIANFKSKINIEMYPDPIDAGNIVTTKKKLKDAKKDINQILSDYIELKDKIAFGGNWFRAILNKPKVYSKDIDSESYERINNNIRVVNYAMDWIEKALIDLYNLNDQDLNILKMVNKIYIQRNIYESDDLYSEASNVNFNFRNTPYWEKERNIFFKLYNYDLNKLGAVKNPSEKISINIGQKVKMTFKSYIGNTPGDPGKKLKTYAQVPTSVHLFNVNKDLIVDDQIHIADCLLHHLMMCDSNYDQSLTLDGAIKKYNVKANKIIFNLYGNIGLTFSSNLPDTDANFGILIDRELRCKDGRLEIVYTEEVGDADNDRPESDHPIKDTFQDIDRATVKYQQKAKKKIQDIQNVGRAVAKPVNRTKQWLTKMVIEWKDKDENRLKEKMADPHTRSNLFSAISTAIKYGALLKAGLLLNPIFLGLSLFNHHNKKSKEFRIRNEMIGELKTELEVIKEKKKEADYRHDYKEKYQLMRLENEIKKKLLRVGGTKEFKKII